MNALGENVAGYKIRDMIKEVDIDENGTVEFNEFVEVYTYIMKTLKCIPSALY